MNKLTNNTNYKFSFKILINNKLYNHDQLTESELFKFLKNKSHIIIPSMGILDSEQNELSLGDIILYRNKEFKSYYYLDYAHEDGFLVIPFNKNDTIWDNIDILINESKNFTILGNRFSNKKLYNRLINKYSD
jgi:hypothetical protein